MNRERRYVQGAFAEYVCASESMLATKLDKAATDYTVEDFTKRGERCLGARGWRVL